MITVNLGSTSPNAYIYNNTFDSPCSFRTLDQTEVGAAQSVHPSRFFQNNHYIGYSGGITSTYGGTGTVNDQGSEIFQSESTANGQGYTTSNNYAPASTSGATVGTGSNLTSFCNGLTNATAASACKNGISAVMYDAVNHVAVPVTCKARPSLIGSPPTTNTIGIAAVAALGLCLRSERPFVLNNVRIECG